MKIVDAVMSFAIIRLGLAQKASDAPEGYAGHCHAAIGITILLVVVIADEWDEVIGYVAATPPLRHIRLCRWVTT